jgi:peptidoglycan hydrolase-like protein with peptidoglycan-binding domain
MPARAIDLDRSLFGGVLPRLGAALARSALALWRLIRRRPLDSLAGALALIATGGIVANAMFLQAAPHPAPMLPGKPRPVATAEATGSVAPVASPTRPVITVAAKVEAPSLTRTRAQIIADIQRELSRRGFFDGPTDGVYGPKTDAAIRDFEQAAGLKGNAQPDEALLKLMARSTVRAPGAPAVAPPATAATTPLPPPRPTAAHRPAPTPAPAPKPGAPAKRVLAVQRALADYGYGQLTPNGILGAETKSAIERFERERKLPITGQISERLTRELAAVTGRPLE